MTDPAVTRTEDYIDSGAFDYAAWERLIGEFHLHGVSGHVLIRSRIDLTGVEWYDLVRAGIDLTGVRLRRLVDNGLSVRGADYEDLRDAGLSFDGLTRSRLDYLILAES